MACGGARVSAGSEAKGLRWLVAAAIAVLVPFATYLGADAVLQRSLQMQLNELTSMVMQRIEIAIDRAAAILKEADARALEDCSASSREALRVLVFESPVLKEIAVLGRDGAIRCNNIGNLVQITPASSPFVTADPRLSLAVVVARGPHGRALRVMWKANEEVELGGLVAVGLFVPYLVVHGADVGMGIDIEIGPGGRLVSVRGPGGVEGSRDFVAVKTSSQFPVRIVATATEGAWRGRYGWMVWAATLGMAVFGLIFAAVILFGRRKHDPIAEMHRALANGEFIPHYQPILDIDTGRILGCEVLVRWRKPDGSIIPPGSFIGEAERSGFIFPLTLALMRQAAIELGPTYLARPQLKCGFNLCAAHFRDDAVVADVVAIFANADLKLSQVLLEVTERDPLPDMDTARAIIARFQDMGVRVALDDVGTGHGGMSYLLKLRVDVMKIDKLFIDALGAERQSTAIVDSLIDLAAHLGMDVVAEGVETFDQVEALRRRGVRSAQGYVFAPPLPGSSYVQLVEAMEPAAARPPPVKKALRS
jgi:sensor c-di-GMP phosphodiesterase-like protein